MEQAALGPDTGRMVRRIGSQIRRARLQQGLTLQHLSDRTGLSVSMLSLIERGQSSPSIGSLVAVCDALGTSMTELFEGLEDGDSRTVIRHRDQQAYTTEEGVRRRILLHLSRLGVEFAENEYQPGTRSAARPVHHAGIEFGVLLSGVLEVHVGDEIHVLYPMEVIQFESERPHLFVNPSDEVARTIWVNLHDFPLSRLWSKPGMSQP